MRRAENLATMRVSDSFLPKVYRKRTVYIFSASFSTFSSFEDKADKSDIPGAGITARSLLEMRFRSAARDFILFGYRSDAGHAPGSTPGGNRPWHSLRSRIVGCWWSEDRYPNMASPFLSFACKHNNLQNNP